MYRVHINGVDYVAPDLATLQQWINEGRLLPDTFVWVESMQAHKKAAEVPGVTFGARTSYAQPPNYGTGDYPRQNYAFPTTYEKVPNNLALAIAATVLCCMPFGVVAIVYSSQVEGLCQRGQIEQARTAADKARNWAIASIICGFVGTIGWIALSIGTSAF
jgi:hypothetical protein